MEDILKEIEIGDEDRIRSSFKVFNEKNKANFKLEETTEVREKLCSVVLSQFSKLNWSHETTSQALNALRILSREHKGSSQLTNRESLLPIIDLAGLNKSVEEITEFFDSHDASENCVNVLVEAVKCLCNLVLNNRYLASTLSNLGCLATLRDHLGLCHWKLLPHDVVFFNLRLLFLITACGQEERVIFRDDLKGLPVLINLIDSTLYLSKESPKPDSASQEGRNEKEDPENVSCSKATSEGEDVKSKLQPPKPVTIRDQCYVLQSEVPDKTCLLLSEALKIVFNQTVNWREESEYNEEELQLLFHLSHLLRLIMSSIPLLRSNATMDLFNHCCEVVMNLPFQTCCNFLLPQGELITPSLRLIHPNYYMETQAKQLESTDSLYYSDLDQEFEGHNLAVAVCLINCLNHKLLPDQQKVRRHDLSVVLGAMSLLSKGNRTIRRFFKSEILPPLKEVKERPEAGNSLKSRVVRLMTAGSHDCMDIAAEFLFVICKESPSRLVKYTGYGNSAGLLMARGLLGGGHSKGQEEYSSDSEDSDTEEYQISKQNLDPVTGAPSLPKESPLDHMTPEEMEREAEKLGSLFDRLNKQGIFKLVPLDKDNNPIEPPDENK